jgi:two-component system chemotaxis response regulator CheB
MTAASSLHVLAIDDSAVVREALRLSLAREPGIRLTVAADALIAETRMAGDPPDVILLDLDLPRVPGLEFLERLMQRAPLPVVICSSAPADGEQVLRALALGAVDVVRKPDLDVHAFEEAATLLADSLRAAAAAKGRIEPRSQAVAAGAPACAVRPAGPHRGTPSSLAIAIGASTGGTDAILRVLRELPPDIPGIVIVQHMPAGFTTAFAQRLDRECPIAVREAADGDRLEHGLALLAPGGQHMRLRARGSNLHVEVVGGPLVSRHRPSVDVLFHSVAEVAGASAVGVILTGMGDDGADGMLAMRRRGAVTFAQDEESCVVYGMPLRAQERGGVLRVLPLSAVASHIVEAAAPLREPRRASAPFTPLHKQP